MEDYGSKRVLFPMIMMMMMMNFEYYLDKSQVSKCYKAVINSDYLQMF
jgi:hypothetical protein